MASVHSGFKQTNGYFLVATAGPVRAYTISSPPSGAGGSFKPAVLSQDNTDSLPLGTLLKDMGKTVVTGAVGTSGSTGNNVNGLGPRFFRKVQLLNTPNVLATATVNASNGVSSGAAGTDAGVLGPGYNTFYIELPTSGQPQAANESATLTYVAGMPGLAF